MKPVYSCIVKCSIENHDFRKWRTVRDLLSFTSFLDRKFPGWKFFNVYDKKTKEWLECFKQDYRPYKKTLHY